MKKSTLAITILLAASFAAQAQTVGSANIMGYTKIETPTAGKFEIISLAQFSSGSNTVNIQDAIADVNTLNAAGTGGWDNADKIIIWNGLGYTSYGLYQPVAGDPYWMASGAGWTISAFASPANVELPRGQAVWLTTGTGGAATNALVSGDVYLDETFDVNLNSTFSLLSFPYSATVALTNLVISNATSAGTGGWDNADKIIIWNGSGYTSYGLYQPAAGDTYWMASGAGWVISAFASPADIEINLGKGFWYQAVDGAKTIGFTKSYAIN